MTPADSTQEQHPVRPGSRRRLDRLVPAQLHSDEEALRLGRLLVGASLMVGTSSIGLAAARFVLDEPPSLVGVAVLMIAVASFATLGLFQLWPRPAAVGTVLTSAGMLGTCTMALFEGGLFSEGLYWALFVPLLTALFTGPRGAGALAGLGTLYMTVLLAMHLGGHDFGKGSASVTGLLLHHMGLVGALGFGAFIGGLFERNRISALEAQRETEARAAHLKDEFISVVSHELRTPLTAIRGGLGLLAGGGVGELDRKARQLVDLSLRNAERLGVLIDDLLDLQRLERGGMEFNFERVVLRESLEQSLQLNEGYAGRARVTLTLVEPLPDATLRADAGRLQQILANLVSNAVKFSPKDGEVRVSATVGGGDVVIEVADQGPGVPEAARALIFERFRQVDASDQRSKAGSGLGLNIALRMAEQMGGHVGLRPEVDVGSVFYLQLPAATTAPARGSSDEAGRCDAGDTDPT